MDVCFEPFNVSTVGRPKPGPKSRGSRAWASSSSCRDSVIVATPVEKSS